VHFTLFQLIRIFQIEQAKKRFSESTKDVFVEILRLIDANLEQSFRHISRESFYAHFKDVVFVADKLASRLHPVEPRIEHPEDDSPVFHGSFKKQESQA